MNFHSFLLPNNKLNNLLSSIIPHTNGRMPKLLHTLKHGQMFIMRINYIRVNVTNLDSAQDCANPSALAVQLPQSNAKPLALKTTQKNPQKFRK